MGDLGGFCHTSLAASPPGGMIAPILSTGTSIAEAGAAPLDLALVGWDGGDFSADGGATWSAMTLPPGVPDGAGAVALSADGSALVWTPENQSYAPEPDTPFHSTDHGKTWTAVSGLPAGMMAVADPVSPRGVLRLRPVRPAPCTPPPTAAPASPPRRPDCRPGRAPSRPTACRSCTRCRAAPATCG